MIRSETEYQEAVSRLQEERGRIDDLRQRLESDGLSDDQIQRATDPLESFHDQLAEEVASYERLRRGEFGEIQNLHGIGRLLIGLRIAQGISQRELAQRLGVHESQVSRDERNEYHGVTIERAERIIETLHAELRTTVTRTGNPPPIAA
jgi:DNA-directed RNA polymerase specialized sigma subunit